MPASRVYNPSTVGGGGSVTPAQVADAEEIQTQEFQYNSGTVAMFSIPANAKIISCSIEMQNAFDGTGASIIVGDAGDTDRLMQASKNDPYEVSVYSSHESYEYAAATLINIIVTAGTATTGNGYVTLIYNLNN